jgi:hypothetical protein
MLFLVACGDNNDTIFTGLSGVLLIGIAAIVILHYLRRNR